MALSGKTNFRSENILVVYVTVFPKLYFVGYQACEMIS